MVQFLNDECKACSDQREVESNECPNPDYKDPGGSLYHCERDEVERGIERHARPKDGKLQ